MLTPILIFNYFSINVNRDHDNNNFFFHVYQSCPLTHKKISNIKVNILNKSFLLFLSKHPSSIPLLYSKTIENKVCLNSNWCFNLILILYPNTPLVIIIYSMICPILTLIPLHTRLCSPIHSKIRWNRRSFNLN